MTDTNDSSGSRSLRALAILEAVAASDERPLTTSELIDAVGLPKATVHRLCGLLEKEKYLRREPGTKRLTTGTRLTKLTFAVLAGTHQRTHRRAVLQSLAAEVGETCNISVPDGGEMIYYDRVETKWPLRLELLPGDRVPLHCTASGKLFLSTMPKARRRRIIAQLPMKRCTPNTITESHALAGEIDRIAAQGVGEDNQEFLPGMVAIAVPVLGASGRFCMAVAMHAPVARLTMEEIRKHAPRLRRAAEELSTFLDNGGE